MSRAASSSRCGRGLCPAEAASAAATPKISTGVVSGSTSSGSRTPPRRAPSTIAAPVVPRITPYMVNGKEYIVSFVHSAALGADLSAFALP